MTSPNVHINWCRRESKCVGCLQPITVATPCIVVVFWNKGNPDKRSWNVKKHYHPSCWLQQGLDYLQLNPYHPGSKRGPKCLLTPENRKLRYTILRRKSALDQRRRNIKASYPDRLLIEARLDERLASLMIEISKVGGIPTKWLEAFIRVPTSTT